MECYEKLEKEFKELVPRKKRSLKSEIKTKEVIGFDTETINGYARLICSSDNRFAFCNNIFQLLKFLTQRKYSRTLNVFWNIDYDFMAIIKHLPKAMLPILYELKAIVIEDYFIRWIPKKAFEIRKDKQIYRYFDLYQFYHMSLNEASKKYLNDQKEEIDIKNIEEYFNDKQKRATLIKYCTKDAQLTAKLGSLLQDKLNELGIDFSKPYSPGYIAMHYFYRERPIHKFFKAEWEKYAFLSYFGGRFEVLRRGYFDKVYQYDINSAYPYALSKLIDVRHGIWIRSKDIPDFFYYGFVKVQVNHYEHDIVSPLPYRRKDGLVFYPNVTEPSIWYLTYPEYQLCEKLKVEMDLIDGWFFLPNQFDYLFSDIKNLYEARKKAKKNDKAMDLTLKLIMNSLYGKFAERETKIKAKTKPFPGAKTIKIGDQVMYFKLMDTAGSLFNPVYASYITSLTRVKLLESCIDHFDHVLMFATDSILTDKPFLQESEELGEWKLEMQGEAVLIMSGVYSIRNDNEIKTRFRGFPFRKEYNFFDLLEKHGEEDKLRIEFEKAIKLGEAIHFHNLYDLEDICIFKMCEKELNPLSDEKRDWITQPIKLNDLLENQYDSVPRTCIQTPTYYTKNRLSHYERYKWDSIRFREIDELIWYSEAKDLLYDERNF